MLSDAAGAAVGDDVKLNNETQPVMAAKAIAAVRFDILSPLRNTNSFPRDVVGDKLGRNRPQIRTG